MMLQPPPSRPPPMYAPGQPVSPRQRHSLSPQNLRSPSPQFGQHLAPPPPQYGPPQRLPPGNRPPPQGFQPGNRPPPQGVQLGNRPPPPVGYRPGGPPHQGPVYNRPPPQYVPHRPMPYYPMGYPGNNPGFPDNFGPQGYPGYQHGFYPGYNRYGPHDYNMNFDYEQANFLTDTKIVQNTVFCVICGQNFKGSEREQHLKLHMRRPPSHHKDGMTSAALQQKMSASMRKPLISKPIIEPEEHIVHYEPRVYDLVEEIYYDDPSTLPMADEAVGVDQSFSQMDPNMSMDYGRNTNMPSGMQPEVNPFSSQRGSVSRGGIIKDPSNRDSQFQGSRVSNNSQLNNSKEYNNLNNSKEYNNLNNSKAYNNMNNSKEYNNMNNIKEYNNISNSKEYNNISNSKEYNNLNNSKQYNMNNSKQYNLNNSREFNPNGSQLNTSTRVQAPPAYHNNTMNEPVPFLDPKNNNSNESLEIRQSQHQSMLRDAYNPHESDYKEHGVNPSREYDPQYSRDYNLNQSGASYHSRK